MWTCTRCGEENAEDVRSCANCLAGGEPVPAPPKYKLRRVWSTTSPTQAELLRVALRRAGIDSILENEGGASFAVGMATSVVPLGISVADPDAERAADVIRSELETQTGREPATYIPPVAMLRFACACGKTLEVPPDFEGLEMDCPYCGKAVTASGNP